MSISISGFYPSTWRAQLAPSEKWGGSFDKIIDQNSPVFQSAPLTKLFPLFLLPLVFHWAIYTFNKTLPLFFIPSILH